MTLMQFFQLREKGTDVVFVVYEESEVASATMRLISLTDLRFHLFYMNMFS